MKTIHKTIVTVLNLYKYKWIYVGFYFSPPFAELYTSSHIEGYRYQKLWFLTQFGFLVKELYRGYAVRVEM